MSHNVPAVWDVALSNCLYYKDLKTVEAKMGEKNR
jgi:hypothetical protein